MPLVDELERFFTPTRTRFVISSRSSKALNKSARTPGEVAMLRSFIVLSGLLIGSILPAAAQPTPTTAGQQELRQAVEALSKKYDEAFNNQDAAACAALFTASAVIVPEGPMISGRQAIENNFLEIFKNLNPHPNHLAKVVQVQALGDKLVWVVGEWSVTIRGPKHASLQLHGNWGAVDELENGQWKIQMLTWNEIENSPGETTGSTTSPSTPPASNN
jgi:uncharacterized protein (TIGR02246 family)